MSQDRMLKVQIRIPERLWLAAKDCADSVAQSRNAFVVQAVAQRLKNWKDCITGESIMESVTRKKPYDGWVCEHGSHADGPAIACKGKGPTHKKGFRNESYPGVSWEEYCHQEGIQP